MKDIEIKKVETPYFLIDEIELEKNIISLKEAFQKQWKNIIIGYSFKTNSLPWIITKLKKMGLYAEVVSKDEYELAKYLGYSIDKIIYNGPIKSKKTFLEALEYNAVVNLDSLQEVNWLKETKGLQNKKKLKIGVRVNFDLEKYCPGETSSGERGGRFGFNYENNEFLEAIEELRALEYVEIIGIHLHTSTKTRSLNIYRELTNFMVKLKNLKINLEYIDIGGGFFGGLPNKPQYSDYAQVICDILKKNFDESIKLIIEPGASLIASPISFITEVKSVKKVKNKKIVTIDGSCTNINPLMHKKIFFYELIINEKTQRKREEEQIVTGFTCMENDEILELKNELEIKPGDLIRFNKVGSYTMTLSPLFIEYFPTVIVKSEANYFLARERWSWNEFIQKNFF